MAVEQHSRRERVAAALFELVRAEVGGVVGLVTSSRVLKSFAALTSEQMPALFQAQRPESNERGAIGLPSKRTMRFEFFLYTMDPQVDGFVPATQLNDMVEGVETAIAGVGPSNVLTLGGMVVSARIDGPVEYFENATNDGKSIAIVPVAVLMP